MPPADKVVYHCTGGVSMSCHVHLMKYFIFLIMLCYQELTEKHCKSRRESICETVNKSMFLGVIRLHLLS